MKIQIDFKSAIIGALLFMIAFLTIGFKPSSNNDYPRYQAVSGERGFIILDTYSGNYILDSEVNYVGKMRWIKGDFESSFNAGKDKTKSKKDKKE